MDSFDCTNKAHVHGIKWALTRHIVGNPNRKKMHIFVFVGIFEYICLTTFNIILSMYTKPKGWMQSLNLHIKARN